MKQMNLDVGNEALTGPPKPDGLPSNSNRLHPQFHKAYSIAIVCHEANAAYCFTQNDDSQKAWNDSPEWQRESAINGVLFRLDNPNGKTSDSHDNWLKEKEADGWRYGEIKNPETKEHPCFVPYEELPEFQKKKDALFCAVVDALK